MNKQELVAQIAGKVGITKKDTANAVDAFIETVTDTLSRGEKVTLVGFGYLSWLWHISGYAEKGKDREKSPNGRENSNTG